MSGYNVGHGIDAETGRRLSGWDHVQQSLRDIFTTRFGARIMREWYGSFVPEALGRNITPAEMLPVIASITSAIEQWEPRYDVVDVKIDGDIRDGNLRISLTGRYRPLALLGDSSVTSTETVSLIASSGGVQIAS